MRIETLKALPGDLSILIEQSELEGYSFVRRLREEWVAGRNQFSEEGEILFAARAGACLAGVCGINIDPYAKKSDIARLRHLYVLPVYRSQGVGSQLVKSCIESLHPKFRSVRLRVPNAATGRFYEKLGFIQCDDSNASHVLQTSGCTFSAGNTQFR